ncbi:hypothetical protein [Turicimonas muris]|uniref:hypothetical protein n=1 Tax=Turicimonas muris TaxID=1796652 RepID=UPI002729D8D6|nr:hypothetical protein [Turicimonas muris]
MQEVAAEIREKSHANQKENLLTFRNEIEKARSTTDILRAFFVCGLLQEKPQTLTACTLETTISIARAVADVCEKYPLLFGEIRGIKVNSRLKAAIATCSKERMISLNPRYFCGNHTDKIEAAVKKDFWTSFSDKGGVYQIMAHELGHAVHFALFNLLDRKGSFALTSIFNTAVRRRVVLKHGYNIENSLSKYARKNCYEFFAEAFCELMCSSQPRIFAQELGVILEEITDGDLSMLIGFYR